MFLHCIDTGTQGLLLDRLRASLCAKYARKDAVPEESRLTA